MGKTSAHLSQEIHSELVKLPIIIAAACAGFSLGHGVATKRLLRKLKHNGLALRRSP